MPDEPHPVAAVYAELAQVKREAHGFRILAETQADDLARLRQERDALLRQVARQRQGQTVDRDAVFPALVNQLQDELAALSARLGEFLD